MTTSSKKEWAKGAACGNKSFCLVQEDTCTILYHVMSSFRHITWPKKMEKSKFYQFHVCHSNGVFLCIETLVGHVMCLKGLIAAVF